MRLAGSLTHTCGRVCSGACDAEVGGISVTVEAETARKGEVLAATRGQGEVLGSGRCGGAPEAT